MARLADRLRLTPQADDHGIVTSASGRYRGRPLVVQHTVSTVRAFPVTRLVVTVERPLDFELRILRRSFFASSPDETYGRFGDETLDRSLLLATTDETSTATLFDDEIRDGLRGALSLGAAAGEVWLRHDELRYSDPQHLLTGGAVDRLACMASLLCDMADRTDRITAKGRDGELD